MHNATCAQPTGESFNGYTQAVASLLGGGAALLPMLGERCMQRQGCARLREVLLVIGPLGLSGFLYLMSVVKREDFYAASYILFHVGFECLRVLCEAEGARCVANTRCAGAPRFAAVSGLNTTASLLLQTALQLLFNNPRRLPLDEQFRFLAALLVLLSMAYGALSVWRSLCSRSRRASDAASGSEDDATTDRRAYVRYRDAADPE